MNATPQEHALLSPSAAHRWMRCRGSVRLESELPDSSSEDAAEGTAAHECAAECLIQGRDALEFVGRHMSNGVEVTAGMADYVQLYVDDLLNAEMLGDMKIEQKIQIGRVLGLPPEAIFGTADATVDGESFLGVYDLKYGRGVAVDAESNEQLCLYAIGKIGEMFTDKELAGFHKTPAGWTEMWHAIEARYPYGIEVNIHQPRLSPEMKSWACGIESLKNFAENARAAGEDALKLLKKKKVSASDLDFFEPGEKQCRFCRAKGNCKAYSKHVEDIMTKDFESLDETIEDAVLSCSPEEVALHLEKLPLVEMWVKSVYDYAYGQLETGNPIPGFKLIEGRKGARSWTDEKAVQKVAGNLNVLLTLLESSLKSPTQAEKVLKDKPEAWKELEKFITRKDGKPKIAPESDPAPAIGTVLEEDFDDLEVEDFLA